MCLVTAIPRCDELGAQYLVWRYAGMLPLLFFFQVKAVFDGIGWTRIGMVVGHRHEPGSTCVSTGC